MNTRSTLLLLVAGVIAFGTALLVRNHITANTASASTPSGMTRVLVAASDIPPGNFIRADEHLVWMDWPKPTENTSFMVEGRVDMQQFNGAVSRRQILKGEPVTEGILVQADEGGFMAAVLKPGMRAVSIAADATTGNAGFISPGDRVDLIITHSVRFEAPDGESRKEMRASETFIEDVRVLAVDQKLDNPENTAILAKTVTLEVSREQAEKINVAKDMGKISLSLRSLASEKKQMASLDTLVTRERHATRDSDVSSVLVPHASSEIAKVVVIRGAEREELEFGH